MKDSERIPGTPGLLSGTELAAAAERYAWFLPARIARARAADESDPLWEAVAPWRAQSSLATEAPEADAFTAFAADDIIERFLGEEDLRIVADEGAPDGEVRTAAELDDEDELVSEELAEIYLAQGLREQAAAIYRKLSLLNPEKSVYFAELIRKTEN
jgi:hypothetical protein